MRNGFVRGSCAPDISCVMNMRARGKKGGAVRVRPRALLERGAIIRILVIQMQRTGIIDDPADREIPARAESTRLESWMELKSPSREGDVYLLLWELSSAEGEDTCME
jgi:hypothetical protein